MRSTQFGADNSDVGLRRATSVYLGAAVLTAGNAWLETANGGSRRIVVIFAVFAVFFLLVAAFSGGRLRERRLQRVVYPDAAAPERFNPFEQEGQRWG